MPQDTDPPDDVASAMSALGYEPFTPPVPPNLARDLAPAMGFSPDVLPANRAGQMTDEQVRAVQAKALYRLLPALSMALVLVFFLIARPTRDKYGRTIEWTSTTTTVVAVLGLFLVSMQLPLPIRTWADARSNQALMAEGTAAKRESTGKVTEYLLLIDRLDFIVPKAGYDLLQDGQRCRVYYTPRTKTMLSLELV